jgi:hypothetical protein
MGFSWFNHLETSLAPQEARSSLSVLALSESRSSKDPCLIASLTREISLHPVAQLEISRMAHSYVETWKAQGGLTNTATNMILCWLIFKSVSWMSSTRT